MCTIIVLVFLLPFFILEYAGEAIKFLTLIFLIGAVVLFVLFSIILAVLSHKKFFNKYDDGWKKVASKILKYSLIIEMISNVCCFLICLAVKSIF